MSTLDDYKNKWCKHRPVVASEDRYDLKSFKNMIRIRIKKQNNRIFGYFWTAFALQNIFYGLLCYVMIRYGSDLLIFVISLAGILITIPFTVYMMKRYKQLAVNKLNRDSNASIYEYINRQRDLLLDFFKFKKAYEWILIPFSTAIGVALVFDLFVPGGVLASLETAIFLFLLTVASCFFAIRSENRKYFIQPLDHLEAILDEFQDEG